MKYYKVIVCVLAAALMSGCSTEPYQKSVGDFAKGIASAQSALTALDRRNVEALRLADINSLPSIGIVGCDFGKSCNILGLPESRPIVPKALLAMAKVTTYTNGLIELAAAKDTDAIKASVGKVNAAAAATLKSFESQVTSGAIAIASGNVIALIANEIIDAQRFEALQDVIRKNRHAIDRTLALLADQADELRETVFYSERSSLKLIADKANNTQNGAERVQLIAEVSRRTADLNAISTTNPRPAFQDMRKAHRELANAILNPSVSFEGVAAKILEFVAKSQALEAAVRKG